MSLYLGTTEITKLRDLAPQTGLDITDLWFGSTNIYTVWQVYEGTLPATIISTGGNLRQYQVWGNVGGVGKPTENMYNKNNASMNFEGYINNTTYTVTASTLGSLSIIVPVEPNTTYTIVKPATSRFRIGTFTSYPYPGKVATAIFGDRNGDGLDYGTSLTFTTSNNTSYILAFIRNYTDAQVTNEQMKNSTMVLEGATPETYVPFGYEVDIGVGSWSPYATHTGALIDMTTGDEYSTPQYSTSYFNNFFPSTAIITVKADTAGGGRTLRYMPYDENQAPMLDYKAEVQFVRDGREVQQAVTIPSSAAYYGVSYHNGDTQKKISITTPIYIGDDPLDKDEYVDYQAGKILRRPNNLYDANATDTSKGYLSESYLYGNSIGNSPNWFVSEYMPILAGTDYIASGLVDVGALAVIATINIYNSNKQLERYKTIDSSGNTEINSGINGAFIRISVRNEHKNTVVVKSKNATPTDPPVPLPALPTCDETTVIDYEGQSVAPEKVLLKYRKEGF